MADLVFSEDVVEAAGCFWFYKRLVVSKASPLSGAGTSQ
jgi:hypothetical protein